MKLIVGAKVRPVDRFPRLYQVLTDPQSPRPTNSPAKPNAMTTHGGAQVSDKRRQRLENKYLGLMRVQIIAVGVSVSVGARSGAPMVLAMTGAYRSADP
jgi:hypothetical protein